MNDTRAGSETVGEAMQFATERLDYSAVAELVGVKHQTIRKWVMTGRYGFPRPVPIGGRRFFLRSEVDEWIRNRR